MPIDSENRGYDIRLFAPNGEAIELGKVIDCELTMTSDTPDIGDMEYCKMGGEFSFTAKMTSPRTNRKHFINELERYGYSRKLAKRIARSINGNYGAHLWQYRLMAAEKAQEVAYRYGWR